jgi:RES domain-containing protein
VTLWRISNRADLTGAGGMRAAGRWHSIGRPIVYLSEHPASCLLEALAYGLGSGEMPRKYQWLEVDVSDVTTEHADLPASWSDDVAISRHVGDAWFARKSSALLRVPSVLSPATGNFLLNPRHRDAERVRVVRAFQHALDEPVATRA